MTRAIIGLFTIFLAVSIGIPIGQKLMGSLGSATGTPATTS